MSRMTRDVADTLRSSGPNTSMVGATSAVGTGTVVPQIDVCGGAGTPSPASSCRRSLVSGDGEVRRASTLVLAFGSESQPCVVPQSHVSHGHGAELAWFPLIESGWAMLPGTSQ